MRSKIHAQNVRVLSKTSALIGLAALATACSNDASRLDTLITNSVSATANQNSIIKSAADFSQPYPGDVATSEVNETGISVVNRAKEISSAIPQPVAPSVSRSSLPTLASAKAKVQQYIQPTKAVEAVTQKVGLAPKVPAYEAPKGQFVLAPRTASQNPLRVMGTDSVTTGSISKPASNVAPLKTARNYKPIVVKPVQKQLSQPFPGTNQPVAAKSVAAKPVAAKPVAAKPVGWENTKGARVTVKEGETLYNLSRRYGVPVSAIVAVNGLKSADSVMAGQRILIPTYNYSKTAPVSAPDSHPVTKASRASTGFQGQARNVVAVPKPRAQQVVVSRAPKMELPKPTGGSAGALYKVQSGDTLSRIAFKHGVTVAGIKATNGMSNDAIRIGQTLRMPSAGSSVIAANPNLDKSSTASIPSKKATETKINPIISKPIEQASIADRSTEKVSTAAKSGAGTFRWPTSGRVISKFGERTANGVNDGIDISVPIGTPIKASENGTVIYSGSELEDFGKLILISHDGGWVTAYAHASAALVRRGDKVRRGQVIAKSGRTGNATTPKLHFELRKNSKPIDPLNQLSK